MFLRWRIMAEHVTNSKYHQIQTRNVLSAHIIAGKHEGIGRYGIDWSTWRNVEDFNHKSLWVVVLQNMGEETNHRNLLDWQLQYPCVRRAGDIKCPS